MKDSRKIIYNQLIPVSLSIITAGLLIFLLWLEISLLDHFLTEPIVLRLRFPDILVGAVIYLKTSIDFAIYIAELMSANRGWRSRIAIEIGTALGNAAGTFLIVILWAVVREIRWLLACMIIIAALVLLRLAEEGFTRMRSEKNKKPDQKTSLLVRLSSKINTVLKKVNAIFNPVLKYIIPDLSLNSTASKNFKTLFFFSLSIPFILGLDDFAGYVPVFSLVNVFGFAAGVFLGHMLLNMFLYISPKSTINIVENYVIAFLGNIAFIALAVWGILEAVHLFI